MEPWLWDQYQETLFIQNDIFVPRKIRKAIFKAYSNRIDVMTNAQELAIDRFLEYLEGRPKGKF